MTTGIQNLWSVLSLGVVVAVAASALRAQGLVVVEQLPVGVAAVLAAAVEVDC